MPESDVKKPKEPPKPVQIGGESLVDRILPYLKQIIIGVVVLAVIATVILGIRWWKHHGQEKQTAELAEAFAVGQRPIAAPEEKPDPKNPKFADTKERAKAVLDEMTKRGATPPGHAYRAGLLMEAGSIDDAIAEYRLGVGDKGIDGVLALEGLGIALEAKAAGEKDAAARQKLLEEALATYQRMQPDEKGARHPYALYHQGRLQAALGKTAEAKTLFEKANELITTGHSELSELRELLSKRLAALGAG